MTNPPYDLLIQNACVVRPALTSTDIADIAINDGKIVQVAARLNPADAAHCHDAKGLLAFPGAIDAHTHVGIYTPPYEDAPT